MTTWPKLNQADVQNWAGGASFERGQRYFQRGHILDPRCQGNTLKAQCLGSYPQPYRVQVTLGAQGILAGACSCPVGAGGHCKHAVALLLTWLHEPDAFREMEELETALERRSKAELVALIGKMVERYPDLERLLELTVLGDREAGHLLAPEIIRRQVENIFYSAGDEWGAAYGIASDLEQVLALGDDYAQRQDWPNAATVYQAVIQGVLAQYGTVDDEGGELHGVVNDCVAGLGNCLAASDDPGQRGTLLRALFDVYHWDVQFGGIEMGYQAPDIVLEQATPQERQRVAGWMRAAIPQGDTWSSSYRRRAYGGFLLSLEEDELDDEAFLRICRETGRLNDLTNRLLVLGRADEAVAEARQAGDWDLLNLADVFLAHDHADLIERLIRERAPASKDTRLTQWLKKRAEEKGDLAEALTLSEALFWQQPSLNGYCEVREKASALERWPNLRAAILDRLTEGQNYRLLTEIHLNEGEIDEALAAVEQLSRSPWGWTSGLHIQVARAAEGSRPREAIQLYMAQVARLIDARGRDNYATAAGYLSRVRDLYAHLGEQAVWQRLITGLREQNRALRALKDELNKAGL